jgi:hypothetical protein
MDKKNVHFSKLKKSFGKKYVDVFLHVKGRKMGLF